MNITFDRPISVNAGKNMLAMNAERIRSELPDDALVLDVGGWGSPFDRADWVLDIMPYETRGLYGYDREAASERFSESTWVIHDICGREPWPFKDNQFDFVVCSHTLEDIRDPIWVCHELSRVAKAGYVETPSRAQEQSWGVNGAWVGWSHHRWLVDVVDGRIRFVHKPGLLQYTAHYPAQYAKNLSTEDRVMAHWWTDALDAEEHIFIASDEFKTYLQDVPDSHLLTTKTTKSLFIAALKHAISRRISRKRK